MTDRSSNSEYESQFADRMKMDENAGRGAKIPGIIALGWRQLRMAKGRAALAVLGVAVAVVLIVLMTGLGYGMTQAGTEALTYINQDLWASAGPLQLAPGTVGGVQNTLVDAHSVQRDIENRPDVSSAEAMGFQSVYISADRDEFDTVVGVGITGNGTGVGLPAGFNATDQHYANGSYTGDRSRSVVLTNSLASQLDVSTGDTVYIGGTLASARDEPFTVVGVNRRFSVFLGAPTAVVHLSELQEVTGTTGSDRASLIGIRVTSNADPQTVATDIETDYPELEVRTQQQQFRTVFENQGAVIATAIALVIIALVVGVALVGNTLSLVVFQQRHELAAIRALGVSKRTLVGMVSVQGICISVIGVGVGIALAVPLANLINGVVADIVGFRDLIKLPLWVIGIGASVGLLIGLVGAVIGSSRIVRTAPIIYLRK